MSQEPNNLKGAFSNPAQGCPSLLLPAIDWLFEQINFSSTKEAIKPENAEKTKIVFETFLKATNLGCSSKAFNALLNEKSGEHAFRKDGVTPNWYHEFREVLHLLAALKEDLITIDDLNDATATHKKSKHLPYGGLDIAISAILHHDSWEDFAKWPNKIAAALGHAKETMRENSRLFQISLVINLLSRKIPVINNKTGEMKRNKDGKTIKIDRFLGHDSPLKSYYDLHIRHILAVLGKYYDSIEGTSTRIGASGKFNIESNIKYAKEKRALYTGRETEAIKRYPNFENALRTADGMLAVTVGILERVNDCYKGITKVHNSDLFNIARFIPAALDGYRSLPLAFRPDYIMIEQLEDKARAELGLGDDRLANLLENNIYRLIAPLIGDRRGTLLPQGPDSASHLNNDQGP